MSFSARDHFLGRPSGRLLCIRPGWPRWWLAVSVCAGLSGVGAAASPLPAGAPRSAKPVAGVAVAEPLGGPAVRAVLSRLARARASGDVQQLTDWVLTASDHQHLPFVIIDKPHARAFAFAADGRLLGNAPVLIGASKGDESVPGIGERPVAAALSHERITPAGRFVADLGRNAQGEDVVWVDYDAAVSMHRVRANQASERRLQRLASPTAGDNRISYGCINVPRAFYERVISPALTRSARTDGTQAGVIYVLPDAQPLRAVFGYLKAAALLP